MRTRWEDSIPLDTVPRWGARLEDGTWSRPKPTTEARGIYMVDVCMYACMYIHAHVCVELQENPCLKPSSGNEAVMASPGFETIPRSLALQTTKAGEPKRRTCLI